METGDENGNMEAKRQTHIKELIDYSTRLSTRYRRLVAEIVLILAEVCWKTKLTRALAQMGGVCTFVQALRSGTITFREDSLKMGRDEY